MSPFFWIFVSKLHFLRSHNPILIITHRLNVKYNHNFVWTVQTFASVTKHFSRLRNILRTGGCVVTSASVWSARWGAYSVWIFLGISVTLHLAGIRRVPLWKRLSFVFFHLICTGNQRVTEQAWTWVTWGRNTKEMRRWEALRGLEWPVQGKIFWDTHLSPLFSLLNCEVLMI